MEAGGWFEKSTQFRNQFESFFKDEIFDGCQVGFKCDFAIARLEYDLAIVARLDLAMCPQRSCEIDCGGAQMKKIERPDIDRAAGKIDARRSRRLNKHVVCPWDPFLVGNAKRDFPSHFTFLICHLNPLTARPMVAMTND